MAMFIKSSGSKLDDRGKRYLTRLEVNVSQMEELIDGLLELSRVGRAEVKIQEVDLNVLIQELADQLQPQVDAERIELVVNPLPIVGAPVIQMKQIFGNLISNGIKYMGDSEERRVEVGGMRDEKEVRLYVKDTGIGIDPAYHDKVFVIFQRLKDLDEVKGTGVGLAIVKKIIESLGGEISLESEKNKGSTFQITLPILEPDEVPETETELAAP
jgi:signal transduction histidine kinase